MNLFSKFLKRKERVEEIKEREFVQVTFDELKEQVNNSLKTINTIDEDELIEPLMTSIRDVNEFVEEFASKELSSINPAAAIKADETRKEIMVKIMPLKESIKPTTLMQLNDLLKKIQTASNSSRDLVNNSLNLQSLQKNDSNELLSLLDELDEKADELKEAISDRNEQLELFAKLVSEAKNFREALQALNNLKDEELEFRKKISIYERDKTFLSDEISRMKEIEIFNDLRNSEKLLIVITEKKKQLETEMETLTGKFSKLLRKEVSDETMVNGLLANPLPFIIKNEGAFNKLMSKLVSSVNSGKIELNEKDKSKYLKALSDDNINEYINQYKELTEKEKSLKKKDFTMLRKTEAFERRLINMSQKVNNDVKQLDSYKEKVSESRKELDAIKSKVEALASNCYDENVRITV